MKARSVLDRIYLASTVLAACCLVLICLVVAAQVGGRVVDTLAGAVGGSRPGLYVPSAAEFTGYLFVAASFLALAGTFRHGGHIRVTLLLSRLGGGARRRFEIGCLVFAAVFSGFFSLHSVLLALDSHAFGEVSVGLVPVPLWIPQGFMALGLVVFTIAAIDDLACVLRGGRPSCQEPVDTPPGADVTVPEPSGGPAAGSGGHMENERNRNASWTRPS